jgi:hypothetical protein
MEFSIVVTEAPMLHARGNGLIEKEFIDVETAKASGRLNFNEMVITSRRIRASVLCCR